MTLTERLQGCLWGLMCGDAVGAPAEFKTPQKLQELYPGGVQDLLRPLGNTSHLEWGQITDDSEMAIALLESLLRTGGFNAADARDSYVAWAESDPLDIGNTICDALEYNIHNPASEANGALMRIAPLAMYAACHPQTDWRTAAAEDARLTHPNAKCAAANVIYVGAVRDALLGLTREEIYANALAEAAQAPALHALLLAAAESEPAYYPNGGWLHHAFQAAFYQLLHAEDYRSAILTTVNRLGDPDTNAAIVGALLGAYFGISSIPAAWRNRLRACRPATRPAHYHAEHAEELLRNLLS